MPPIKHALLGASSANRWIHCPPSARLGENFQNKSSEYAAQGTDAHSLCEYKLRKLLDENPSYPKLQYYDEEMEDSANAYATFVMEELAKAKETTSDPVVIIEQRLDYSKYVPEGFGTADGVLIADGTMSIFDYKHGSGIVVDAYENPQMMCYALGAIEIFDGIYDIHKVKMTIFQPRRENISTYELTKEELISWAEETLKPKAELAYKGEGEFGCGSWCRWCLAKNTCRARAEYNLSIAQHEFKLPKLLSDSEIEEILSKLDDLVSWSNDVKDYALKKALSGKKWASFKLVNGRSVRKYIDEEQVATVVMDAGFNPYEQKLLGITAMTKALGKKKFEEILGDLIEKPVGKLTLVPDDDKRQAVEVEQIKNEFHKITEEK